MNETLHTHAIGHIWLGQPKTSRGVFRYVAEPIIRLHGESENKHSLNINLEIGDFRMETSVGPTLAEFMHGPESVHKFCKFMFGIGARALTWNCISRMENSMRPTLANFHF